MPAEPDGPRRVHRRKGAPSAATRSLLEDYQAAMRAELRGLLEELAPRPSDGQLDLTGAPVPPRKLPLGERAKVWDLAIRLGRELGTELDLAPAEAEAEEAPRRHGPRPRSRVDWG
jgi:hypothetical protein